MPTFSGLAIAAVSALAASIYVLRRSRNGGRYGMGSAESYKESRALRIYEVSNKIWQIADDCI